MTYNSEGCFVIGTVLELLFICLKIQICVEPFTFQAQILSSYLTCSSFQINNLIFPVKTGPNYQPPKTPEKI